MDQLYMGTVVFSAWLGGFVLMRLRRRLAPLFGFESFPLGPVVALPAIAFLMVVQAPAPVLVGALLLAFAGWRYDHRPFSLATASAVTLLAIALGLFGLHGYPELPIPFAVVAAACGLVWLVIAVSASEAPRGFARFALVTILALMPLAAAPLLADVPDFLPLDVAILSAALLGVLMLAPAAARAGTGLSAPFAFLFGFLVLRTLSLGGWPFALGALLVWGGGLVFAHKGDAHAA
ncbi:MAG: hypothetical protein WDN72_10765 [Alphaproteobacteria bacterium]